MTHQQATNIVRRDQPPMMHKMHYFYSYEDPLIGVAEVSLAYNKRKYATERARTRHIVRGIVKGR